jgi:hypothetical protein
MATGGDIMVYISRFWDSPEPAASEFIVPDKLYEDNQVTLYTDLRMDVREDQAVEPESRPTYMEEILCGNFKQISLQLQQFAVLIVVASGIKGGGEEV